MKSKRRNKLWAIIGTLVMVLPLFTTLGNAKEVFAADPPAEQNVIINKRQFGTMPADDTQNTGDKMNFGGTALGGAVFTAYDVTTDYWTAYNASKATSDAGKQTDAIAAIVDGNKIIADVSSATKYVFDATDATTGQASRSLPTTSGIGAAKQNAVYVFEETTSPAGVNQSKSIPFVLGLPSVKDDGTYRTDVYVYPKNEVKTNNLQFTKYGVDGDTTAPLEGAEFVLKQKDGKFFNTKDAAFTNSATTAADAAKVADSIITSGSDGVVKVEGLKLAPGDYEFYEVDSKASTSQNQNSAGTKDGSDEIYHFKDQTTPVVTAHVDANMAITYTYYDKNQKQQTTGDPAAYNYKTPAPKKETPDHDLDKNKTYTYTITQQIPLDVANYQYFDLIDTYNEKLNLISTLDQIKETVKIGDDIPTGVTVDTKDHSGADLANANAFAVHFTVADLVAYAGKTITFTVDMKIKDDAVLNTNLDNKINFDNNFYPKHDIVNVKTFGKLFKKIDAATNNALKGAEFQITNPAGEYLQATPSGTANEWIVTGWGAKDTATTFTSGDKGTFKINGLQQTDKDGTDPIKYQLKETKQPDGYVLPTTTFEFTADDGSVVVADGTIKNKIHGVLPSTGGIGIVAFIAIGAALIAGGVYYFKKRRHNFEA